LIIASISRNSFSLVIIEDSERICETLSDVLSEISTGIDGLDALIRGYPKGKTFLVSGEAGVGKMILALHFLNACKTKKIANANLIRLNT
jgi:replicative DNA helicase